LDRGDVKAFGRGLGLVLLLAGSARAAGHDGPALPREQDAEERLSLSLSSRAGLVDAPFVTSAFPEVSGFASVVTGAAVVQLSGIGWLHVTLPISVVRLDFPARAQVSQDALGNLELGLEHRLEVSPATRYGFLAAVVTPTAQGGTPAALLENRALALGSALNGGMDLPLLTPGVTGLRLAASVEHSARPFELRASLDLPLLVRVSRASLPDETVTHPIGTLPTLRLRAAAALSSWLAASLGANLMAEALRVQEPALERDRDHRLQAVLEPALHFRVSSNLAFQLDASVPVGGSLGGDAWSIGVQGRLGL
jgi:hypothetical protein